MLAEPKQPLFEIDASVGLPCGTSLSPPTQLDCHQSLDPWFPTVVMVSYQLDSPPILIVHQSVRYS